MLKHRILSFIASLVTVLLRVVKPLSYLFNRILWFARLKLKVKSPNPTLQLDAEIDVVGTGNIFFGDYCRIGAFVQLETSEKGEICFGKRVRVNRGSTIVSYDRIDIGDSTLIGELVTIRDSNHGIKKGMDIRSQEHISNKITIGRDVWIGRGVCILPGVRVGDGAVIGANSTVTKDIPSYSIAVGSPARIIRGR